MITCLALLAVAACAQPTRPDTQIAGVPEVDGSPTSPTDSIYGTPPDTIPSDPVLPSASPTGRQPRLIWTPARQQTWNQMVVENHQRFQHIRSNCDRARAGSPRYGDRGLWCVLVYQMTGDVGAARTAWSIAGPLITAAPSSANDVRENFIENAIVFDWLYPALTETERSQAIAGLNMWGNFALAIGTPQYVGGLRTADSDATTGYYFGLAATDLATAGMPGHVNWLGASQTGGPGPLPVGGVNPTGANRSTARNAIHEFVSVHGIGGMWLESSAYDAGTVQLLTLGTEAVRTALAGPSDPFADVETFLREAADFNAHIVTSDLQQAVQWGDEEHPRDFVGRLYKRIGMLGMIAGATIGTPESARAMGLIDALTQQYGATGYGSAEPWARFYLLYDPYAPRSGWAQEGPYYAAGKGHLVSRSGGTLFSALMAPRTEVDHELEYLSDFQLYRNGEWAITHPLGYGGPAVEGEGVNGLLVAGLSAMYAKGPSRAESGNGWWALTGSTQGSRYAAGYYQPPPTYLHQWQRTVVHLQRNGLDHIITVDRLDMQNPQSLANFDRYRTSDRNRIQAARGLVEWIIHAPVAPQGSGNRWTWSTPGGQPVTVTALGATPTAHVLNEQTLWAGGGNYNATEPKWQLRLVPQFTGGQTVLRHVVTVGSSNPTVTVSGDAIIIDGVQVVVTATGVQVIG
ncbi:MAG: hypothetical protein AB7P61_15740 [Gemmatimonadales bacterium]